VSELPSNLLDSVKDNPVVQWAVIGFVVVFLTTNAATRLKGPVGVAARALRKMGTRRTSREVAERRAAREALLTQAQEGREYLARELAELKAKVEELLVDREALAGLVEVHLGWDYDRKCQLIDLGVPVQSIPPAPPLRLIRSRTRQVSSA
jgi:hypothetical protein